MLPSLTILTIWKCENFKEGLSTCCERNCLFPLVFFSHPYCTHIQLEERVQKCFSAFQLSYQNNRMSERQQDELNSRASKELPLYCVWVVVVLGGRAHKSRERSAVQWHRDTSGDTFWLSGIYFLVHAIFVASKLWIWQHFKENTY